MSTPYRKEEKEKKIVAWQRNVEQRSEEKKGEPEKDTLRIRRGSGIIVPYTYQSLLGLPWPHHQHPLLCVWACFCYVVLLFCCFSGIEFQLQ